MLSIKERESLLVEQFVASFEKLDEMSADESLDPISWRLAEGERNQYGRKTWRPANTTTDRSKLVPIYARLPAWFPPLYERLVLSYRWAEVELESFRLLAKPLGPDLNGLFNEMSKDKFLWGALLREGFVRFGKGPDIDYDPVCFDIGARQKNGDYRVVKIDHEEILCNNRVKVVSEIAASFEKLVMLTIEAGECKNAKI